MQTFKKLCLIDFVSPNPPLIVGPGKTFLPHTSFLVELPQSPRTLHPSLVEADHSIQTTMLISSLSFPGSQFPTPPTLLCLGQKKSKRQCQETTFIPHPHHDRIRSEFGWKDWSVTWVYITIMLHCTAIVCAICLTKDQVQHERTEHIHARYLFMRTKKMIKVNKVGTTDNPADMFTK